MSYGGSTLGAFPYWGGFVDDPGNLRLYGAGSLSLAAVVGVSGSLNLSGTGRLSGRTYSSYILALSPLAYYRLGEPSGTTMTDSSGNSRNGTYANSPGLGAASSLFGDSDTAVAFDGTNDYATVAAASWVPTHSGSWSVKLRMKYTSTAFAAVTTARVNAGANTDITWVITIGRTAGYIGVETWDWQNTGSRAIATTAHNDGNWHDVVATFDKPTNTLKLYIDGTLHDTKTQGTTGTGSNRSITIGANTGGTQQWFPGSLDEVAIFGTALTSTQVETLYYAATGGVMEALALSGDGTLSSTATIGTSASIALSGGGTLGLTGTPAFAGPLALSGEGTLTAPFLGSVGFSGSGSLSLDGGPGIIGSLSLGGSGTLALGDPIPGFVRVRTLTGNGTLTIVGTTDIDPGVNLWGLGLLTLDGGAPDSPAPLTVGNRWVLWTSDPSMVPYYLDINPNRMGSPNLPKTFSHARSARQPKDTISIAGLARTRTFKSPSVPTSWEFGGVILTQDQHDKLLEWSKHDGKVNITDHLGRTFEVMMQQFDPTERRPTPTKHWRFDYTMRVLLLRQVS